MNSPFNQNRYERLLEGLEISEISLREILERTETKRFDPEYFQKQHLLDIQLVTNAKNRFQTFADYDLKVDASAFYPAIENYYGTGNLPFLRVADVDRVIDLQSCTHIPKELCNLYPTLRRVHPGDIVFTKGGSVARIGLLTEEAAVSRDLIFLNSSKLSENDRIFLYLYFQTDFFQRLLIRSSSQTAQPHLTITLVRELPIFSGSPEFKLQCLEMVNEAYQLRDDSIRNLHAAEQTLLEELGLEDWHPPEPLTYQRRAKDVFEAGRLDSEYFTPKFLDLEGHIQRTKQWDFLHNILRVNQRGKQPQYVELEGIPVVNSKHINNGEVKLDSDNRRGVEDTFSLRIQTNDVLMNGTGVGTIGRAAVYLHNTEALPDNHVTVLRIIDNMIDPIYLSAFLNSVAGQYQVEKWQRGSSGQIELYPNDIGKFIIWVAPQNIQMKIRQSIVNSFVAKQKAMLFLERAKRAVEIAIEDSEEAGLVYLNSEEH